MDEHPPAGHTLLPQIRFREVGESELLPSASAESNGKDHVDSCWTRCRRLCPWGLHLCNSRICLRPVRACVLRGSSGHLRHCARTWNHPMTESFSSMVCPSPRLSRASSLQVLLCVAHRAVELHGFAVTTPQCDRDANSHFKGYLLGITRLAPEGIDRRAVGPENGRLIE